MLPYELEALRQERSSSTRSPVSSRTPGTPVPSTGGHSSRDQTQGSSTPALAQTPHQLLCDLFPLMSLHSTRTSQPPGSRYSTGGICPGLSSNAPVSGDAPLRQPWMSTGSGGLPILSGLSQGGCGDGGQSGGQTGGTSGLGGGGTRLNPPPGFNFTGGYTPITAVGPRVGNEGFFEGGGGRGQSGSRTTSGGKRDSWATGPHSETPNPLDGGQHVLVPTSTLEALASSVAALQLRFDAAELRSDAAELRSDGLQAKLTLVEAQALSILTEWLWPLALRELVNLGEIKVQTLSLSEKNKDKKSRKGKKKKEKVEKESYISDEALSAYHNTQLLDDLELLDLEILYDHSADSIRGDGNTAAHEHSLVQQREAVLSTANHPWYSSLRRILYRVS